MSKDQEGVAGRGRQCIELGFEVKEKMKRAKVVWSRYLWDNGGGVSTW